MGVISVGSAALRELPKRLLNRTILASHGATQDKTTALGRCIKEKTNEDYSF